jgi:hypothetical protein
MSEAPPADQQKKAKDLTPQERAAALAMLKRGPKPEPMPVDRKAKDMSPAERAEFLREVNRRWG